MHLIISYESGIPIYEQIKSEIRGQILRGELEENSLLPSIRTLAKELKIGIITAKRAYDDLCAEGLLNAVQGKGIFVAGFDRGKAEDEAKKEIRRRLSEISEFAERNSVSREKLSELIKEFTEGL